MDRMQWRGLHLRRTAGDRSMTTRRDLSLASDLWAAAWPSRRPCHAALAQARTIGAIRVDTRASASRAGAARRPHPLGMERSSPQRSAPIYRRGRGADAASSSSRASGCELRAAAAVAASRRAAAAATTIFDSDDHAVGPRGEVLATFPIFRRARFRARCGCPVSASESTSAAWRR